MVPLGPSSRPAPSKQESPTTPSIVQKVHRFSGGKSMAAIDRRTQTAAISTRPTETRARMVPGTRPPSESVKRTGAAAV